jgi:drug/metabolite transporter (DMT)-like permease
VSSRLPVYLGLTYVVFCWGLNTVLVKHALSAIDPLAFTALRFLVMAPLTLLLAKAAGERLHIERRDIPLLIACAACGYGVYQYFWVIGLSHTTPFASALLGSSSPIFTLAFVAFAGQERVRGGRWVGAALALVGVAIFEGALSGHAAFRIGDLLTLIAAAIFAGYNVLSSRLLDRYTPLALLAITMCIGALMIVPSGLYGLAHTNFAAIGWDVWAIYLYAVLFPIVLTYPVWSYGISRLGAGRASLFGFLVPVIAGALSIPILHAQIAAYQVIGGAICLAGMLVSNVLGRVSLTSLWGWRAYGAER